VAPADPFRFFLEASESELPESFNPYNRLSDLSLSLKVNFFEPELFELSSLLMLPLGIFLIDFLLP
jgi:hypothetical protein